MNGLKKPKCTVLTGYKTNSVSIKITVFIFKTKIKQKKLYIQYCYGFLNIICRSANLIHVCVH